MPARRIRKPKIKMEASELRSSTYKNKVAKRKGKRREWREMDAEIRSRWASNLARYQALLFDQKIEFAIRGYIFPVFYSYCAKQVVKIKIRNSNDLIN